MTTHLLISEMLQLYKKKTEIFPKMVSHLRIMLEVEESDKMKFNTNVLYLILK